MVVLESRLGGEERRRVYEAGVCGEGVLLVLLVVVLAVVGLLAV